MDYSLSLNKKSPKNSINYIQLSKQDELIQKIIKTQKLHIKNQVEWVLIQIFDSWAGLINENEKFTNIFTNQP